MKLASILLVEGCDADAMFFSDFFERQRICNRVTRVCDYQDAWLHIQSGDKFDLLVWIFVCPATADWSWWSGSRRCPGMTAFR
jgi:hypothetical protein